MASSPINTYVWIFNVGRGLAVFIRSALNQGIIYDVGSSDDFSPTGFLETNLVHHLDLYNDHRIAQAVLSHPHSDHISEIEALKKNAPLYPSLLTCPHDKEGEPDEKLNWTRIKNPKGTEARLELYRSLYAGSARSLPLQTIQYQSPRIAPPGLLYGLFYLRPPEAEKIYPAADNEYGNATGQVPSFV